MGFRQGTGWATVLGIVSSRPREVVRAGHLVIPMTLATTLLSMVCWAQDVAHIDASTPPEAQIRIAKLAAPKQVSENADIYVLRKSGYGLAVKGNNGFSCLIERERPETMEPECYDAEGSRTTMSVRLFVEAQRAKGRDEEAIARDVKAGYRSGKFHAPTKPGIVYMLSDYNYVLNPDTMKIIRFPGHLMFYAPYATEKTIGSGDGAPYIVHPGQPDALLIVVPGKAH
jgi:hypothetical protein